MALSVASIPRTKSQKRCLSLADVHQDYPTNQLDADSSTLVQRAMSNGQSSRQMGGGVISSKQQAQQSFIESCKRAGLSSQQIVERASFFPKHLKLRVLDWPKL